MSLIPKFILLKKKKEKNDSFSQVQGHSHVQILNGNKESDLVGEKLCKHKYSSYPYCYSDIKNNKDGHEHRRGDVTEVTNFNRQDEKL